MEQIVNYLLMVQKLLNLKQIIANSLCLGNISKDFSTDNMNKTGLYRIVYDFSVGYRVIASDKILDIHKYLMEKIWVY